MTAAGSAQTTATPASRASPRRRQATPSGVSVEAAGRPYSAPGAQGYRTPGKPRQRIASHAGHSRSSAGHNGGHRKPIPLIAKGFSASLNPLRRECRSVPSVPVCSCAHFLAQIAHETAGAACTRHSLHPLIEGDRFAKTRTQCAAGARIHTWSRRDQIFRDGAPNMGLTNHPREGMPCSLSDRSFGHVGHAHVKIHS
jgi:hypothetical protein